MAQLTSLKYPLTLQNGGLALSHDLDCLHDQTMSVLETRPGERLMQQAYGTPDFCFDLMPGADITAGLVEQELTLQVPPVSFEVSGTVDESGVMNLTVAGSLADEDFQTSVSILL